MITPHCPSSGTASSAIHNPQSPIPNRQSPIVNRLPHAAAGPKR
ncbi:MAG: hypothetical protein V3W34_12015 [Phycisphaerae bacterium]